ncbi:tRNA dihydrouridine synthase DusB [Thermodesulfobacteriota bacterium]
MLQIGQLKLENELILAPLAGISNLPFRLLIKGLGAGMVTTEMVSAMGLASGKKKTLTYLKSHPGEKPLAVQLFGSDPHVLALAAQIAVDAGADLIDINMGCPVKKVTKTGSGAALLREPEKVADIVSAVRLSCTVPLTVKIRAGWSPEREAACEVARIVEDSGGDAVTLHPRFASEGFSGRADWKLIGKVKEQVKIPVIGNGDIIEPSQALEMKRLTGCDGIMIGRGVVRNPWMMKQILYLQKGLPIPVPDLEERRSFIMEHFRLLADSMGDHRAALVMRGLLLRYSKGLPYSSRFRGRITRIKDLESLTSTMDAYFSALRFRSDSEDRSSGNESRGIQSY